MSVLINVLKWISMIYVIGLLGSCTLYQIIGINSTYDGEETLAGCYLEEPYFVRRVYCKGDFAFVKETVSNAGQLAWGMSFMALFSLSTLPLALLGWFPIIFLIWYRYWGRRIVTPE